MYKVSVSYLKAIDETKAEAISETLSRGMAARVNQCTTLAAAVKVCLFVYFFIYFCIF